MDATKLFLHVPVEPGFHREVKRAAKRDHRSISSFVRLAVERELLRDRDRVPTVLEAISMPAPRHRRGGR